MKKILPFLLIFLIPVFLIVLFTFLTKNGNMQLLNPQGYIAKQQSMILWGALILGASIGIPVVLITFFIVFQYRDDNKKSNYSPNWSSSKLLTALWWIVPSILIIFLSIVNWKTAHQLDPYKSINAAAKPITIQVVALRWKWLFLYPEQNIATVNFLEIPVNTPIHFKLTADAPMNSFWIPSLGGQIYAMSGMSTQLQLLASKQGDFPGGAAEISGEGFSGMNFKVRSASLEQFDQWVNKLQRTDNVLTSNSYAQLAKPSMYNSPVYYYYADTNLYNEIIQKFMAPPAKTVMPKM